MRLIGGGVNEFREKKRMEREKMRKENEKLHQTNTGNGLSHSLSFF